MVTNLGLVLTSGGARGSYQAGALKAIAEISKTKQIPFPIISGVSAGALNAALIAGLADDFQEATSQLTNLWGNLKPSDIFSVDNMTISKTGLAWIADLGFGGWIGGGRAKSLLKTDPLWNFLNKNIQLNELQNHLKTGLVQGISLTATNYYSGSSVSFYDSHEKITPWIRSMRIAVQEKIELHHVMASLAIPIFFPAVPINGTYYGDGSIRMNTPLSPAIHLGAKKILAIGVRYERSPEKTSDLNHFHSGKYPHLIEIGGVIMNSFFLDALDADIERMQRINQTVSLINETNREKHSLKNIPVMALKPSRDLGSLVTSAMGNVPFAIRHFMKGLGVQEARGLDLMSYLAFDTSYTKKLVELGYEDTLQKKSLIQDFMELA